MRAVHWVSTGADRYGEPDPDYSEPDLRNEQRVRLDKALAHSRNCTGAPQAHNTSAHTWFAREPAEMPVTEMTKVAGNYAYTLTLLMMPDAEYRWERDQDEEPVEDSYDRFRSME